MGVPGTTEAGHEYELRLTQGFGSTWYIVSDNENLLLCSFFSFFIEMKLMALRRPRSIRVTQHRGTLQNHFAWCVVKVSCQYLQRRDIYWATSQSFGRHQRMGDGVIDCLPFIIIKEHYLLAFCGWETQPWIHVHWGNCRWWKKRTKHSRTMWQMWVHQRRRRICPEGKCLQLRYPW